MMSPWARLAALRAVFAIGAACGLVGCGSDSGNDCLASPCNITDASCQKAIFSATACARGQSGKRMPPVRTISLEEYERELGADQTAPSANDEIWERAFQLLGILPVGQTVGGALNSSDAENVAAYYDPTTKKVTVIDRGSVDQQQDLFILSHEFVHSLQDAQVGLFAFDDKWVQSTDSEVAVHALVEGEADILGTSVLWSGFGYDPTELDWPKFEASLLQDVFVTIDSSDAPFFTAVETLEYPLGMKGLADPWLKSGQHGIDAFYEKPRLSVLDWTLDTALGSTGVEDIACLPTWAPPDYHGRDHDTLGITGVMAVFMGAGQNAGSAYDASGGLRGDVVVTYAANDAADEGRAVAWRTRWLAPADVTAFTAAAKKAIPGAVVVDEQPDVTIYAATDSSVLANWNYDPGMCAMAADLPTASRSESQTTMMSRIRHVHRPPRGATPSRPRESRAGGGR